MGILKWSEKMKFCPSICITIKSFYRLNAEIPPKKVACIGYQELSLKSRLLIKERTEVTIWFPYDIDISIRILKEKSKVVFIICNVNNCYAIEQVSLYLIHNTLSYTVFCLRDGLLSLLLFYIDI